MHSFAAADHRIGGPSRQIIQNLFGNSSQMCKSLDVLFDHVFFWCIKMEQAISFFSLFFSLYLW